MAKHFNVSYAKRKIFLAGAEMKQQTAKSIQAFQTLKIFFFTEKKRMQNDLTVLLYIFRSISTQCFGQLGTMTRNRKAKMK